MLLYLKDNLLSNYYILDYLAAFDKNILIMKHYTVNQAYNLRQKVVQNNLKCIVVKTNRPVVLKCGKLLYF